MDKKRFKGAALDNEIAIRKNTTLVCHPTPFRKVKPRRHSTITAANDPLVGLVFIGIKLKRPP